jgi:tRNA threonylcarbamoyl adenosine modification protein YeaZ
MSRVLYLDTATHRLMLGISDEQRMLTRFTAPCESHRYHSAMLIPAIQEMLAEAQTQVTDLTALAVNLGPGSFTGLRTGITTARTMAQFLNLPVYGFNAFEILAANRTQSTAIYLDALRLRAYHAVLRFESAGPVYQRPPMLCQLAAEGNTAPGDSALLVSPALVPLFPGQDAGLIEETFTPDAMLSLIQRYGDFFRKDWRDIRPFYLQAPSITVKPTLKNPA